MNALAEQITDAINHTMRDISKAAERCDFSELEHLTKKASELRAMKDQVVAIENRLVHMTNGTHTTAVPQQQRTPGVIRELGVEVTQGMINQNLLTLSDHIKRGMIRPGESLTIETVPSGDRFDTELLANGNKLQERGKIGKFYREAGVVAGDVVMLSEVTPGQWKLKKGEVVRYRRV